MKNEQTYDIRHPELIMVGKTRAQVYLAAVPDVNPQWHDLSLPLIESVEPFDATANR